MSDDGIINGLLEKDMEGSGRGLIEGATEENEEPESG
jgi:hypothetical protein